MGVERRPPAIRQRPAGSERNGQGLWPYALTAALFLLVLEWWAYHRRHWLRAGRGAKAAKPVPGLAPIIRG